MFQFAKTTVGAAAVFAMATFSPSFAHADNVADFFSGKTVTILVGFSAGGTYGKYSKMLAQFMGSHIPGNPRVKVQHMPGGGGLKAMNHAYNKLPKDGTGLVMPVDTLIVSELLRPEKAKFKSREFTWLGAVVQTNSVLAVRADTGVRSASDLQNIEVVMGATGKASPTFLIPSTLNGMLGTRLKLKIGFKGARKVMTAMERGQVQGSSLTWGAWRASKPQWFRDGFAIPILQVGLTRDPALGDVPMLTDLVQGADNRKIVRFVASLSSVGRGLATPPGVPNTRIAALRQAFDKTVSDPRFLSQSKRRKLDVNPATGQQIQDVVNDVTNISPELVRRARAAIIGSGL